MPRLIDLRRITSERAILMDLLARNANLETVISEVTDRPASRNLAGEEILGLFRDRNARKAVIADMGLLDEFKARRLDLPSFLEAGPRAELRFDPHTVRAAVVTTGGLAPGMHCVIHSIVKRHCDTYAPKSGGEIYGVYNSFRGLCRLADNLIRLDSKTTEGWLDEGGCKLGNVRYYHDNKSGDHAIQDMAEVITKNLRRLEIDILYVIGGDGSMRVAHEIAVRNRALSVMGIPKTMDNDLLWVWQSFGFGTAVEHATQIINTLRNEAEAVRRIGFVELFGAESGFVAANAALASGHVDAVLIPEMFRELSPDEAESYLDKLIEHLSGRVRERDESRRPYGLIVVAEGVGTILEAKGVCLRGRSLNKDTFLINIKNTIEQTVFDAHGENVPVFINEPRHFIRAGAPNAYDRMYCGRLGALAVDNALAGYTDCMVSQWLTEFVLVPLTLVIGGQKGVPIHGMFWKQVVATTGQPLSPAEYMTHKV